MGYIYDPFRLGQSRFYNQCPGVPTNLVGTQIYPVFFKPFPCFEKIKVGLHDHLALCMFMNPSY
jgi:hypothetical protein